jgi:hypothetical protein
MAQRRPPRVVAERLGEREDYRGLPTGGRSTFKVLDAIDKLHRIDNLEWSEVEKIVHHAATVWHPQGFIGSPATLRSFTRKKDRKTWEAIVADMNSTGVGKGLKPRVQSRNAEDYGLA